LGVVAAGSNPERSQEKRGGERGIPSEREKERGTTALMDVLFKGWFRNTLVHCDPGGGGRGKAIRSEEGGGKGNNWLEQSHGNKEWFAQI